MALLPALVFSQNGKMKRLFNDQENRPDFHYTHANSNTEMDLGLGNDIEKLFNNINEIYVLKTEKKNSEIVNFQTKLQKLIDKGEYENLMEIKSDGIFKIYLRRDGKNDPSEVIIISSDNESSMYLWATR